MTPRSYPRTAHASPAAERAAILAALRAWINQRPGLDLADYCDDARAGRDPRAMPDLDGRRAYFAEGRRITQQRADALEFLRLVERREGISADALKEAFRAFSGRLSWNGAGLDYCTGQYFPTEYRLAAAAVLRSALWDYWRADILSLADDPKLNVRARILRNARLSVSPAVFRRWFKEA